MRNKGRTQYDYGTTAPQGGQARTGHFGGWARLKPTANCSSPACEYGKGQVQDGSSEGSGAAGVCPPPPHCGPSWSRVNGWAAISWRTPVPTACRSRSPPAILKDPLPAAGRGGHKAPGNRTVELLSPSDDGESLAQNAGGLPLPGRKRPAARPA